MPQASFDPYARDYDRHFTYSPIGRAQRGQVYSHLIPVLDVNLSILELNCGTGYDAFELAARVRSIVATDASSEMISVCKSKSPAHQNVQFKTLKIQDISQELSGASLIFSNFGGLNCLNPAEFRTFADSCRTIAGPDTELVLVVLSRKCVWEKLYFMLKGEPKKAFRRKSAVGVPTVINGSELTTWYYSPKEVIDFFGPGYSVRNLYPVGLFVPPSYLADFFDNKKKLLWLLNRLDHFFCKFKMLAGFGDHFYIHLSR